MIAILLALMFKSFEAEAFIIPTGSMAPALQGQHKDLDCDQCGYQYQVSASEEARANARIIATTCPLCRFTTNVSRNVPGHTTFNGDRILVNKWIYDFNDPERYDVIVFKNPNSAKQHYIKRLIGLPGENILIEGGDIYTMTAQDDGSYTRTLQPKPSKKLLHIAEKVADTKYFGSELRRVEWPQNWQQRAGEPNWSSNEDSGDIEFQSEAKPETSWLSFRLTTPEENQWPEILELAESQKSVKDIAFDGRLISDYVAHNDGIINLSQRSGSLGLHWVGDVGVRMDCDLNASDQSGGGMLYLDLVEGGAHFQCALDTTTGQATLTAKSPAGSGIEFVGADGEVVATPIATTALVGSGRHTITFFNADDRLHLWIDGTLVEFDAVDYRRSDIPVPHWSAEDPGDAQPLAVGCQNLAMKIHRLEVLRDVYYVSAASTAYMQNETGTDPAFIMQTMRSPEMWSEPEVVSFFRKKKGQTKPMFFLKDSADPDKDQFLPMGDNSAQSLDGRVWAGPKFVERDLLAGRAMVIFWPHSLKKPVPFFPNFGRMGFIR